MKGQTSEPRWDEGKKSKKTWSTPTNRTIFDDQQNHLSKMVLLVGKENMPRKGKGDISEGGQEILEDRDIWTKETTLRGVIHESRKRERSNEDGLFMLHQKGPIT